MAIDTVCEHADIRDFLAICVFQMDFSDGFRGHSFGLFEPPSANKGGVADTACEVT